MTGERAPIFDYLERTNAAPSDHREPTFDFLNRVAGEYWVHPRQLMQAWADHIPDPTAYNDLRQRFRSHDNYQFGSAFLELYLHECLTRAGYRVTIHPSLPTTTRRPDFYAERAGAALYLEAIAPGASKEAKGAAARRAVLFDTVNRLGDPNFLLWLSDLREGPRPPASARLRDDLRRWLSELNPDDFADLETAPEHHWEHDGWAATFKPIAMRPDARGRPQSAIGVYGHLGASVIDDAPAIRNALAAKHHAYGDLGAPFVVAVGTYIFDLDRRDSANALYGREAVQLGQTSDGQRVTRMVRQPDGYFGVPGNWQHKGVTGVLLINQLMPYNVDKAEITLWRHPDPFHPLADDVLLPAVTVDFDGSQLSERPATVTAAELFELPDPWPPGERWPRD